MDQSTYSFGGTALNRLAYPFSHYGGPAESNAQTHEKDRLTFLSRQHSLESTGISSHYGHKAGGQHADRTKKKQHGGNPVKPCHAKYAFQ